jgi:hypothetical protein
MEKVIIRCYFATVNVPEACCPDGCCRSEAYSYEKYGIAVINFPAFPMGDKITWLYSREKAREAVLAIKELAAKKGLSCKCETVR